MTQPTEKDQPIAKEHVGEQPCYEFRLSEGHRQEYNVHECPRCLGVRWFCGNCSKDHHQNGWDSCKPYHEAVGGAHLDGDTMDFPSQPPPSDTARRCAEEIERYWEVLTDDNSSDGLEGRLRYMEEIVLRHIEGVELNCNGSCDISLARRQVGPDAVVPSNARECAELWEREASRLTADRDRLAKRVEELERELVLTQRASQQSEESTTDQIAQLRGLLKSLEWSSYNEGQGSGPMGSGGDGPKIPACPICKGCNPADPRAKMEFGKKAIGHQPNCLLLSKLQSAGVTP